MSGVSPAAREAEAEARKIEAKAAIEEAKSELAKIELDKKQAKKMLNGQPVVYNARKYKEGIVRIYEETGSFIGIGNVDQLQNVSPKRLISTN